MIIQAGFDLQILVRPLIVQEGKVLPKLVVISLDADMQLDGIKVVSDEFAGSLMPHHDAILDGFDPAWTTYFAIAHAGTWTDRCYGHDDPILKEGEALKEAASKRGLYMVGHFGLDETGYMAAGPHSYFDQYPFHSDLPRTMSHWVHSKYGKCG